LEHILWESKVRVLFALLDMGAIQSRNFLVTQARFLSLEMVYADTILLVSFHTLLIPSILLLHFCNVVLELINLLECWFVLIAPKAITVLA